ncbi:MULTISPECIES: alpha/beta hydrolase family protein [Streptomyces]|uniref:alpha/beta hydrolase family protein n=1 Tax=Streptomyces TaxID=1883 RepID=UPI000BDA3CB6|nr:MULTISPECIES: acetylhydrolase [Streptomyces]MDX2557962.1 acetylhydrolase [Streptomyces stelliscabiei]MDX2617773.1 acetylhydrolase [Streptomyces stelliscabiei]MDX2641895.1 acetylhydrolase [Streptomyces stelliscabiei]MDX2667724.1 acetylhydrolase [Streptomyces stelliscabiei]MDX2793897.1 acetylhydrolase [Streptomyces stelliscabiei]
MNTTPFISRKGMTRRRMLGAALAAGTVAPLAAVAGPAWAGTPASAPTRLSLPEPTGPHPVGTVQLHLVDRSRPDDIAGPGHFRELVATVWYPARDVERYPVAPWMPAGALQAFLADAGLSDLVPLAPLTAGHVGAPVRRSGRRLPVVVFSHGAHSHQGDHTVMVQELASHGYAAVTVAHQYDTYTEFPDGRVVVPLYDPTAPTLPGDFAEDLRFVLDSVEQLAAGCNPDVGRRELPAGLLGSLDPRRMGAFGWSKGGTATACAMLADERIQAGLSLDGPMQMNPPLDGDLDRPFMMMSAKFTRATDPQVAAFWSHLQAWRLNIQAQGAAHISYGDNEALFPQVARLLGWSAQQLQGVIGTLDPDQAVKIQQSYPLAFFDEHLRHRRGHLLDGPSSDFPAVAFLP